jgi:hypothetical protein
MIKALLALLATAFLAVTAPAQQTAGSPDPKTGVEMTGIITDYTPGASLVVRTMAPNEPVHFRLAKNIKFADADGKPLEAAGLSTNQKVRIHYMKIGGDNVADKISLIGN